MDKCITCQVAKEDSEFPHKPNRPKHCGECKVCKLDRLRLWKASTKTPEANQADVARYKLQLVKAEAKCAQLRSLIAMGDA